MIEVKLTFATEQEMLMYFQARDNEALRKQADKFVEGLASIAPAVAEALDGPEIAAPAKRRGRPPKQPEVKVVHTKEGEVTEIKNPAVGPLDVEKGDPLPTEVFGPAPDNAERIPPEVKKSYSRDEVQELMKKFSAAFGIDALRQKLIEATGFARLSEIPTDKYVDLASALVNQIEGSKRVVAQ
jgi:hypothetical protein